MIVVRIENGDECGPWIGGGAGGMNPWYDDGPDAEARPLRGEFTGGHVCAAPVRHVRGWVRDPDHLYQYGQRAYALRLRSSALVARTGKQVYYRREDVVKRIPLPLPSFRELVARAKLPPSIVAELRVAR